MESLTTLYIDKESHKFSAAHYTIFSASERERLHGHNYSVSARIVAPMGDNGFSADYNVYKNRLAGLCDALDEYRNNWVAQAVSLWPRRAAICYRNIWSQN